MPRRVVNLALLIAVPVLVATGLLAWIAAPSVAYGLILLHRVAGVGLVLALAWKYGIARRSVRRRTRAGIDMTLAIGGCGVDQPVARFQRRRHGLLGLGLRQLTNAEADHRDRVLVVESDGGNRGRL